MKRFIFCYLILFPFTGNSQQLLFNKTYSNTTGAGAVIERADGKFLIAGSKVILVDSAGNMIWEKERDVTFKHLTSMIETKDQHYLLSGQTNSNPGILKLDTSANTIWNKEFPGNPTKENAYSIVETYDSNYIFLSTGLFEFDTSSVLFKINSSGDTLWSKSFSNVFCYSVTQTIDSGFLMVGSSWDTSYGDYSPIIIKTNSYGDMKFKKTLSLNFSAWGNSIIQILALSDGGWIIYYGVSCTSEGGDCGSFIRFDSIGNIKWGRGLDGHPKYIKQCKNGDIIVSSVDKYYSYKLYITRLDSNGIIRWSRHFEGWVNPNGNNITQTRDGGFVLTGYTQYGIFLVKLDSAGNYVVSVNDISKSVALLSVYPNPADDEITFSLNSGNRNLISEITIYNVCGQEVKHIDKLAESNFKWNVNDLDPGIYFYHLKTDDKQVIHGKFFLK